MNTAVTQGQAAVAGALHQRLGRPGQDAALTITGAGWGVAVVCDGCGSAPASEVGARLGVRWWSHAVARRLAAGASAVDPSTWSAAQTDVLAALAALADSMGPDRAEAIGTHLLFTTVAGAVGVGGAAVYAIGDGIYGEATREVPLPQAEAPAYLAYALVGGAPSATLHTWAPTARGAVWVGTDGITAVDPARRAEVLADPRATAHPDWLRRQLVAWARPGGGRPAALVDDGAIALLRWGPT